MLVLNTNKGGNSSFAFNNQMMEGAYPDFDNSICFSPDKSQYFVYDNMKFFYDEVLVAPYCFSGNTSGTNYGIKQEFIDADDPNIFGQTNYLYNANLRWVELPNGTQELITKGGEGEIDIKCLSRYYFKGGEVVGKRILGGFYFALWGYFASRYNNGYGFSTKTLSNMEGNFVVEIGLLQNGVMNKIAEKKYNFHSSSAETTLGSIIASNPCATGSIPYFFNFDEFNEGLTANEGDRLYIRFYTERKMTVKIAMASVGTSYALCNGSIAFNINFGNRGNNYSLTSSQTKTIYRYNGGTGTQSQQGHVFCPNTAPKQMIQISVD